VGANLFQSGITNWCLMDKILARLGVPKGAAGLRLRLKAQAASRKAGPCPAFRFSPGIPGGCRGWALG